MSGASGPHGDPRPDALSAEAAAGDAAAQYALGLALDNADGRPRDAAAAAHWYAQAAAQGHAQAALHLGLLYDSGDGVAADPARAVALYGQAAAAGLADAQVNLGLMHLNGSGVPRSEASALQWFLRAAEAGQAQGQFNAGALIYNGAAKGSANDDTGAPDYADVYCWWTLAALQGHPRAAESLELVTPRLDAAALARAQAAVAAHLQRGLAPPTHAG